MSFAIIKTSTDASVVLIENVRVSSSSTTPSSSIPTVIFAVLSLITKAPVNELPTISDAVIPIPDKV